MLMIISYGLQKDKVIDLTRKIKNRVRKRLFEEAEDFTEELSIMNNAGEIK